MQNKKTVQNKKTGTEILLGIMQSLGTMSLVIIIVLCIPCTIPRWFGYQSYHVISGSMEPEIPEGSLVYTSRTEPETVEKGDIIAFYSDTNQEIAITHRVVANNADLKQFVTKGDANEREDKEAVEYRYYIGSVICHIPRLGRILSIFTSIQGKVIVGCIIALSIFLRIISEKLEKKKKSLAT